MKVDLDIKYNKRCPEEFDWGKVNSPEVQVVAEKIATAISCEIARSRTRALVPGLRYALHLIAEQADIY